jgi:hypothetical protein
MTKLELIELLEKSIQKIEKMNLDAADKAERIKFLIDEKDQITLEYLNGK